MTGKLDCKTGDWETGKLETKKLGNWETAKLITVKLGLGNWGLGN